ncbi:hypothetical protein [Peptoclostridium acidaminophilum]|nr:hypothetical protein [Peptoclostridium acidaminophilum]
MEKEGKVGPFFYLEETVVSDSIRHSEADVYGVYKTWSSHDRFWTVLGKFLKQYRNVEYFLYPRGRVTYNTEKDIFYVYLNPILNTPQIVDKIVQEFNLSECDYLVDDTDVHYKFYTEEEFDDLMVEHMSDMDEY